MKIFLLTLIALVIGAAFSTVTGQLSQSAEPRAQIDPATGEMIIMGGKHTLGEVEVTAKRLPGKKVYRNVAQRRNPKQLKKINGYYQMQYGSDWGTGARMNSYGHTERPSNLVENIE